MTLDDYLHERRETVAAFAERSGVLAATIAQIRAGRSRCRIDIAERIVRHSKAEPTADGQWVDYPDLIPEGDTTGDQAA